MEVADKVVPVIRGQAHKGAAHEDELHLVHHVTQLQQLVHSAASLTSSTQKCSHR